MVWNLKATRYMQYLSAIAATFASTSAAVHAFWPSPALVELQSEDSPIGRPISDEEGSWVVSLPKLAVIPSALIGALLIENLGRKYSILTAGLFLLFPWFLIAYGRSVWFLYVGRFVAGIADGILSVCITIYIGEVAENDIRGKLSVSIIVQKVTGSLLVLCVGPYVSYETLAMIGAATSIVFLSTFVLMPESPYYLVKSGKPERAEKNLRILSSNAVADKFVADRLHEINDCVEEDMRNKTTLWEFLSNPDYRKAILILIGAKSLHQLSGESVISSYMQTIISLSDSNISEELSSIIFGFIQLPAALASGLLIDKVGRRPLVIISALGCAIALYIEGTFFYFQDKLKADMSSVAWMPTVGLTLFLLMTPLGIVPLSFVLLSELFPTNIKGIAVSSITVYAGFLSFLVSKFFKPLANILGIYAIFWFFGSTCLLGIAYVVFVLPETKGKSFIEIQAMLRNNKEDNVEVMDRK